MQSHTTKSVVRFLAVMAMMIAACAAARASDFLDKGKVVQLIVPFTPGGSADVAARIMAETMSRDLGVTINVITRPGASGQIGIQELVRGNADGTSIAMVSTWSAAQTYLSEETKSYGRQDIRPVARAMLDPNLFVVPTNSPFKTIGDILNAAKEKPGAIKFGTTGNMSAGAIMMMILEKKTGARFTFVPFGGGVPTATALARGDLQAAAISGGPALPFVQSSQIRVVAMIDDRPQTMFPGAPVAASQGYPLESLSNFGFILPGKTPTNVVDGWGEAIGRAVKNPDVAAKIEAAGLGIAYMPREQYEAYWSEVEKQVTDVIQYAKQR
jgi:tripartite-type tricarboxylate transporter receptor subunit TctC